MAFKGYQLRQSSGARALDTVFKLAKPFSGSIFGGNVVTVQKANVVNHFGSVLFSTTCVAQKVSKMHFSVVWNIHLQGFFKVVAVAT